jgi:hypothetical protein
MSQVSRALHAAPSARARRLRRLLLVGGGSVVAVPALAAPHAVAAPQAAAAPLPLTLPSLQAPERSGDHLTVTVRDAGEGTDGTYELRCHPGSGSHPDAEEACAALDRGARWGKDTFAPVPPGGFCTMQYGGPATAHVTGTWAGRPVDATYDRSDGCEIARWDRLVPVLPDLRPRGRS